MGSGSGSLRVRVRIRVRATLASTVCVVECPSKVAVSVVVPALCERSRDEASAATVVLLELNALCVVTW